MDLKLINKQIAEIAKKLPLGLCRLSPEELLNIESIIILQQSVLASANTIEAVNSAIRLLSEEVQNLRNENNELKGEQGHPDIRPQAKKAQPNDDDEKGDDNGEDKEPPIEKPNTNISSEAERRTKDNTPKKKHIILDSEITRTEIIKIDPSILPDDAVFKGYQSYTVQDIIFQVETIQYNREKYYSASAGRSYVAELPVNYDGSSYGPSVKTLIITLYHQGRMSQPSIQEFLSNTCEFQIAKSTISRILTDDIDVFHQEKVEIVNTGLLASSYSQIDDTSGRVNGQNYYVHVLCSPLFTSYFTRKNKDRLTIIEILAQRVINHIFNETTYQLLETMGLSAKVLEQLDTVVKYEMTTQELEELLDDLFKGSHAAAKKLIVEASAIIAYRELPHAIETLVCDDAPQFKQITELLALCWVHAARHYKKLTPIVPEHKKLAEDFITALWEYYHKLLEYKNNPKPELQLPLSLRFDELFSTITGYDELDDRIAKTKNQKDNLLVVLEHPELPLHNNLSELAARAQARKRDVSYQTKNEKGTEAKDTFMTMVNTAIKLGVNVYAYIKDRITNNMKMPSLASIIADRGREFFSTS